MKKIMLYLMPLAVACHTKTMEEKIQDGIKAHLSKTMHDFKSYEPVEFKKPDSTYTSYGESERGQALLDSIKHYNKVHENYIERSRGYTYTYPRLALSILNEGRVFGAKADSLFKIIDLEKATFEKRFNGYEMLHTFRGKNMNNATILTTKRFYLDTAFNVTRSVEVE